MGASVANVRVQQPPPSFLNTNNVVFPRYQIIDCGSHFEGAFCDVRECASGGMKSVSHDLRTTGSKRKEVVHTSLGVHRQVVSISGTRKSTRRRGVFAEDSSEGCHGPPKAAN